MILYYTVYDKKKVKRVQDAPDAVFQTWLSISSFRQQWGAEFKILVYTNNAPLFKKLLNEFKNIEVIDYPAEKLKHKDIDFLDDLARFKDIRITLTAELLEKYKTGILYCDPDTGVARNSKQVGYDYLKSLKKPYVYCEESWNHLVVGGIKLKTSKNSGTDFFDGFLFLERFPETMTRWNILRSSLEFNVGIIYFPYNKFSIEIAKELDVAHDYVVQKLGELKRDEVLEGDLSWRFGTRYWFNDQIAISLIWNKYSLPTFYRDFIQKPKEIAEKNYKLIHYFMDKERSSKWQRTRDKLKQRFIDQSLFD